MTGTVRLDTQFRSLLFIQFSVRFLEEAVGFHRESRMRAFTDQPRVVEYLYRKVELSAVKGGELAFADDPRAEGRGGEMVDVDVRADRGDPFAQQFLHAFGTAAFDQRDHRGRRENSQRTAAHRDRGILHRDSDRFFSGKSGGDVRHNGCSFQSLPLGGKVSPNGDG